MRGASKRQLNEQVSVMDSQAIIGLSLLLCFVAFSPRSRFSVLYRERYERRGIDSFVSLADLKVVRTKRVISDERCGTCCPFGQKGNFALHPGVNASDLFAHGALVASALHDEKGIS